jgi:hypothetical protein
MTHEPLRVAYSREEIMAKMTWGRPMDLEPDERDRWMGRNGMLYAFLCDQFPANVETPLRNGQ